MDRVLADASTLIAMAQIGELEVLRDLLGEVHVTEAVEDELVDPAYPDGRALRGALEAGWVRVVGTGGGPGATDEEDQDARGLSAGEASVIAEAGPDDLAVLDDLVARRVADVAGVRYTGLLGLLVAGVRHGRMGASRGLDILGKLARSDFRMTVELYDWARVAMEETKD